MKVKVKAHFYSQFERLKSEGNIFEYIFWWITRVLMIYGCIKTSGEVASVYHLAIILNTLATFAVPVFSVIFPQRMLLGRLSFRTQTYINFFVIIGSFLGQCINAHSFIDNYDKWQHFLTGFGCIFLGGEILKTLLPKEKLSRRAALLNSVGFSFSIIVLWEIFEFFADFFIAGSTNQDYTGTPDFNMLFFRIFGRGAGNVEQYPLFDTMFDMMAAVVGIALAVIVSLITQWVFQKGKAK